MKKCVNKIKDNIFKQMKMEIEKKEKIIQEKEAERQKRKIYLIYYLKFYKVHFKTLVNSIIFSFHNEKRKKRENKREKLKIQNI